MPPQPSQYQGTPLWPSSYLVISGDSQPQDWHRIIVRSSGEGAWGG